MRVVSLNRTEWFGNIRGDLLSGMVVALALIPEAIAFSIIAGVDPKIGLYASFSMAVVIAFAGGRPAMISAATGAMALVLADLVKEHGLQYLFATTVVTGVIQVLTGANAGRELLLTKASTTLGRPWASLRTSTRPASRQPSARHAASATRSASATSASARGSASS